MSEPSGQPDSVEILLVDDNPAKILALQTALAPLGQRMVSVTSGRDALRHLLTRDFATVILDVHMPDMDGFETAQFIRARPRSAHTPIIFVSAINLAETDALRGYALGAVDYIVAPIIPEVLRAKVAVFVELHRKTEEARAHARRVEEQQQELKSSQEKLRLAERMAALGTFAAGLGHDMGNLLFPMRSRIESLNACDLSPDAREDLEAIAKCAQYLQNLTKGLRSLSRDPDEGQLGRTDLTAWLETAFPFLRHALSQSVELVADVPPGLPAAPIADHSLTQAVLNLVTNSGDALKGRKGGKVTVGAWSDPQWLYLRVTDNGPGMTDEVRRRCLEPFFTTKPLTVSTGLGLALVHSLATKAGGRLEIESAPNAGTKVTLVMRPYAPPAAPVEVKPLADARSVVKTSAAAAAPA